MGNHAIVIGASRAAWLAAPRTADFYATVTILERDAFVAETRARASLRVVTPRPAGAWYGVAAVKDSCRRSKRGRKPKMVRMSAYSPKETQPAD